MTFAISRKLKISNERSNNKTALMQTIKPAILANKDQLKNLAGTKKCPGVNLSN